MSRFLLAALLMPLLVLPISSQEKKKQVMDPLMASKLKEGQTLLEGLALNDFSKIQQSAEALLKISKEAQFRKALNTPQYELHANNFQRAAEAVIEKAKAKNIDGATLAYLDLALLCVRCHQHTREEGIGKLIIPGDGIGQ